MGKSTNFRPILGDKTKRTVNEIRFIFEEDPSFVGTGLHGKVTDADIIRYMFFEYYGIIRMLAEFGVETLAEIEECIVDMVDVVDPGDPE